MLLIIMGEILHPLSHALARMPWKAIGTLLCGVGSKRERVSLMELCAMCY